MLFQSELDFTSYIARAIHMIIGLRSSLIHWRVKEGKLMNAFLIALGAFFIALFMILQYVRLY